jgi:outer membrane protein assembly factor BamE (lipoprotein component of BamABCDE complex)
MYRIASAVAATAAIAVLALPGGAQQAKPAAAPRAAAIATIDPGMSKADVVAKLGKPASERTRGEFTYVFYANGMEKTVGTSDFVTLQNDKVIDAVFRSSRRAYSGTSSSPKAITPAQARKAKPPAAKGGAATP